jgi:hypothetical protein
VEEDQAVGQIENRKLSIMNNTDHMLFNYRTYAVVLSDAALPAVIALVLHNLSVVRFFTLRAKNELQKEGKVPL